MTSFDFVTLKFTEYVPRNLIQRYTPDTVVVNEYGIPLKTMRCLEVSNHFIIFVFFFLFSFQYLISFFICDLFLI